MLVRGPALPTSASAVARVSESRFHEMRAQALGAALAGLEPAPVGRPREEEDPKDRLPWEK